MTIFAREWGQKTSLTKLVIKRSVLKQSLPNSQRKLFFDKAGGMVKFEIDHCTALCVSIH